MMHVGLRVENRVAPRGSGATNDQAPSAIIITTGGFFYDKKKKRKRNMKAPTFGFCPRRNSHLPHFLVGKCHPPLVIVHIRQRLSLFMPTKRPSLRQLFCQYLPSNGSLSSLLSAISHETRPLRLLFIALFVTKMYCVWVNYILLECQIHFSSKEILFHSKVV